MKTIRTLATVMLAAFLVLGPVAAFGATSTMTLNANAASYSGMADITYSGTISPAPTIASNVVITTTGPSGAVDINSVAVATGTGAFTYTLVSGGNANWVSGTYTVNGTWGAQGNTATKTTTFSYSGNSPGGSVSTTTTTVTSASVTVTVTTTTTTAVATATITSSDASALASIQSSLTLLTASVNTISSDIATLTTDVNGLTSSLSTISAGVTGIQNSITSSTSGFGALAGVPGQLTTLTTAVNNDQTYVLVVAALAAITLVLELAILVRKLS